MSSRCDTQVVLRSITRLIAAICLSLGLSTSATAQNLGTIFSDLWWIPSESGWGVTVDHQQRVMFLTWFIFRADGSPYWVVAALNKVGANGPLAPPLVFTGDLYEVAGPYFGAPDFNQAAVTGKKVGTATFTASSFVKATLQYSINGVNVTKNIERQFLQLLDFSGLYLGGVQYQLYNCSISGYNGQIVTEAGTISIDHAGTAFHMSAAANSGSCVFNGTYAQTGSLGEVEGTYSCSDGTVGTFGIAGMQWSLVGMSALMVGKNQICEFAGIAGGITTSRIFP